MAHRVIARFLFAIAIASRAVEAWGQDGPLLPLPPTSVVTSIPSAPQPVVQPSVPFDVETADDVWAWRVVPDGLVYRSYLAGVKEPRLGLFMGQVRGFGTTWDAQLGGRVALLRYGTPRAYRPEGWELQFEGAALPRLLPLDNSAPLVSTDFRAGFPVVYARGPWQFKTGYAHLSSHLGDEYMQLHPTVPRINYVRDAIMFGLGYYYTDDLRLYGEVDYGANIGGGAKPWEFQVGADYSPAVLGGAPFAAVYADLRPEVNGGYFVVQSGWQWRGGAALHTLRVGAQYLNGKSPQFEFFNQFETQIGVGIWYDY
jgi:hypothetical protein